MRLWNTVETGAGAGGGAWGGSADFVALTALYVFAFHMAMGVQLVGSVLLWFGIGGWRRGSLGAGAWAWAKNNSKGVDAEV